MLSELNGSRLRRHALAVALLLVCAANGLYAQTYEDSLKARLPGAKDPVEHLRLMKLLSRSTDRRWSVPYAWAMLHEADSLLANGHARDRKVLKAKGSAFWSLQMIAFNEGLYDSSLVLATRAVEQLKLSGDTGALAEGQTRLATMLAEKGRVQEAIDLVRQAMALDPMRRDSITLVDQYSILAVGLFAKGEYVRSAQAAHQCIELADHMGLYGKSATCLHVLGGLYYKQGLMDTAIVYYRRCMAEFEKAGDHLSGANELVAIASVQVDQRKYAEAIANCETVIPLLDRMNAVVRNANEISLYATLGMAYQSMGKYDEALKYGLLSVSLTGGTIQPERRVSALTNLGNTYYLKKDYPHALAIAKQALALCDSSSIPPSSKVELQSLFTNVYYDTGHPKEALEHYITYVSLRDSLSNSHVRNQLAAMDMRKQELTDSLRTEGQLHAAELAHVQQMNAESDRKRLFMFAAIGVLVVAGGLWWRLRYVHRSRAIIQKERDRSEELLLNILPAEVAEELKSKGEAQARDIDQASILFTDFKGFTRMSEQLTAQELVAEINVCFKAFDSIIGRHGIEKIKTIGDAYMAAGGLPLSSPTSAHDTVLAALEMQAFMEGYASSRVADGKPAFTMRVGIHTGPVVAGIVGVKKFAYDIWGDTVNIASRMESSGEVGHVNISESTYALVKDMPGLAFTARGRVQAKGKGELEMFYVEHRG